MKKNNKVIYIIMLLISFILVLISKFMSPGWMLIILLLSIIWPIHLILYLISNIKMLEYINDNKKNKILFYFSIISFLLGYIFMIDGGDDGITHTFFGLIRFNNSNNISNFLDYLSTISIITNVITIIMNFSILSIIRKYEKEGKELKKLKNENEKKSNKKIYINILRFISIYLIILIFNPILLMRFGSLFVITDIIVIIILIRFIIKKIVEDWY